jgi:outer membrane protein
MQNRPSPCRGRGGAAALAAAIALCAGCTNPLVPREGDHARQVTPERLRAIELLEMERFVRPPAPEPPEDPIVAARRRFADLEQLSLTVDEARAAALEHNLSLRVALISPTIAAEDVRAEEARFEPAFTTRALWQESEPALPEGFPRTRQDRVLLEPGVRIPLRTGGIASVSLPVSRSAGEVGVLDPAWTTDVAFSIAHPLLRDAGRGVATTGIRIAAYNRQISEAQTKLEIIQQLALVERIYWRLYQARRELEVRQHQYELAQVQLERANRLVNAGRTLEIDVIRAQAGLAERLEAIIISQNLVLAQQRELKRIMNEPGLEIDTPVVLVPTTPPEPVEYLLDAHALADDAVHNRMELLETELRLMADAATIRFLQNQTLPRLDVDASYRRHGLDDDLAGSLRTLGRRGFDSWTVGASLDVPLGNQGAQARLRQGTLSRLQRLATHEARELLVRQDVHDAVDRIDAGWQRILATRQATILAARAHAAEQRQFEVGLSTSTFVLDAATRLVEAQLAEIRAVVDYQIAQIELAQAAGRLLAAARVVWEPAPADAR